MSGRRVDRVTGCKEYAAATHVDRLPATSRQLRAPALSFAEGIYTQAEMLRQRLGAFVPLAVAVHQVDGAVAR